jgi:membrane fusion protein, heavy metal efflux system
MYNMKNITYISIVAIIIILSSCNSGNKKGAAGMNISTMQELNTNQVELTIDQIKNAEIEIGHQTQDTLAEIVNANGLIQLPPNDRASINALYECFIDKIYHMEGEKVNKGDVLVSLKHPNFIQLQQEYLQAQSEYNFLLKELDRQQLLSDSNVTAKKKLQQTESDLQSIEALKNSLSEKLKLVGINPEKVVQGNIQSIVYLRSPISGVVTKVTGFKGLSILPQQSIMEVINNKGAYLELNVFEKNLGKVKANQMITFKVSSIDNSPTYSAKISSVGSSLDLTSRSIKVIAHFDANPVLIPGLYIEAAINAQPIAVSTLPEEAIIFDQNDTFIFIQSPTKKDSNTQDDVVFTKIKIKTGRSNNGKIQIINEASIDLNSKIVIKGANYLKSEMSRGKGDDE